MATYYKYQKRDEGSQIDWNTIGKSISDGLFDEVKDREKKKEKIQKETTETLRFLSDYEKQLSQSADKFVMNASTNAVNFLREYNRLLKSGQIKPSDYNLAMQTLKGDFSNFSNAMKTYNATYVEAMQALQNPDIDEIWKTKMQRYLDMGDLKGKDSYVTPEGLFFGSVNEDGTIDKTAGKLMNAGTLNRQAPPSYNKFMADEELTNWLGRQMKEWTTDTGTTQVSYLLQSTPFKEASDQYLKSLTSDPSILSSILANSLPNRLKSVYVTKDENGKYIKGDGTAFDENTELALVLSDQGTGVYVAAPTENQKIKAESFLKKQLDGKISREVKIDDKSFADTKGEAQTIKNRQRIDNIGVVYSSKDPEELERAIKSLLTTSDDRFSEFDQVTVGEGDNAIVSEIIVPYIHAGNKISKPITLHELKKGGDKDNPNDYVAVSLDEFSQGLYETISMGDSNYPSYEQVKGFLDNTLSVSPSESRIFKTTTRVYQDPREGITIASTVRKGKDQTTVKEIYSEALNKIVTASINIKPSQVAALADSLNAALRGAGVEREDDVAANRVSITAEGDEKIIVKVDGKVTQTITIPDASFDDRQQTFEGEIDTIMNELLNTILPALEGGFGDTQNEGNMG